VRITDLITNPQFFISLPTNVIIELTSARDRMYFRLKSETEDLHDLTTNEVIIFFIIFI
jgi:CRISPR/Cas system-associated endonuclease/helicase Cas3